MGPGILGLSLDISMSKEERAKKWMSTKKKHNERYVRSYDNPIIQVCTEPKVFLVEITEEVTPGVVTLDYEFDIKPGKYVSSVVVNNVHKLFNPMNYFKT